MVYDVFQSAEENEIVAETNSEIEEVIRNQKLHAVTDTSMMSN